MPASAHDGLYIGLISGTSVDGIDAALVEFGAAPVLHFARTYPMPEALAQEVLTLSQAHGNASLDSVGQLDTRLGEVFADTARRLLADSNTPTKGVRAIGSHGQTLRHRPSGAAPFTMQLGDANIIAERTGVTTVADFRRRDIAAGGQGAPLVPAFHAAVLHDAGEDRAVLNIGGIANVSLLPARGQVRGFDTGPGNGLMDAWCLRHRGERFDRGGAFAAEGRVDAELLARLLEDDFLALPPPKSTGRDHYHLAWLDERLAGRSLSATDVQATLLAFTTRSIAAALHAHLPSCRRVLACGGGVHNHSLMATLQAELPGVMVESTAALGIDPDFMEAMAFAWLARETLAGRPGNLPEVTGARGLRILGAIYPA
jgi:anhydro-N-acetylmuramic acid kinase